MSPRRRARIGMVVALALAGTFLPGARAAWADTDLGPHEGLASDHLGGCTACHRATSSRRFDLGHDGVVRIPPGGKLILADPIPRFCWVCHREGNPYGARPIAGRSLDARGHGASGGRSAVPEAWALEEGVAEVPQETGLEEALRRRLSCTTCHDVHVGGSPRLLRKVTAGGDYAGLCSECHPGRENAGRTGSQNVVVREAVPYSTHPAAEGAGDAGHAIPTCGDCHDVHRAPFPGEEPVTGLLRIARGESSSDLCRRCHELPEPGGRESHPMEAAAGRLPPGSLVAPEGVPPAWGEARHKDRGATPVPPGERAAPRCTSCHDLHGGLPSTSLLYGPAGDPRDGEDWCFSCHPREALVRLGHAAGEGLDGADCASCHGTPREGESLRWRAHGEFRTVRPVAGSVGPAAGAARAARTEGGGPAADAPPGFGATDPRPGVRAQAATVLGAVAEAGERDPLLALLADPEPEVRAEAALALARTEDPRAAEALLPLLADPAPEVRLNAISAFGTLRDPRAIPALVRLLRDPNWRISMPARRVLASWNDARVLEAMVSGEERDWAAAAHLAAVLADLSDPAALPDILLLLGHRNRVVRMAAAAALERYPGPAAADALVATLRETDVAVKTAAAGSLIGLRDPRAPALVAGILRDPAAHSVARRNMARGLGAVREPAVVGPLIEALADPDGGVREEANASLFRLTCRNFGVDQALWREWWAAQPQDAPLATCR